MKLRKIICMTLFAVCVLLVFGLNCMADDSDNIFIDNFDMFEEPYTFSHNVEYMGYTATLKTSAGLETGSVSIEPKDGNYALKIKETIIPGSSIGWITLNRAIQRQLPEEGILQFKFDCNFEQSVYLPTGFPTFYFNTDSAKDKIAAKLTTNYSGGLKMSEYPASTANYGRVIDQIGTFDNTNTIFKAGTYTDKWISVEYKFNLNENTYDVCSHVRDTGTELFSYKNIPFAAAVGGEKLRGFSRLFFRIEESKSYVSENVPDGVYWIDNISAKVMEAPKIVKMSTDPDSESISIMPVIVAEFSTPVNIESVKGAVSVWSGDTLIPSTYYDFETEDNRTVKIKFNKELEYKTNYKIIFSTDVAGYGDNILTMKEEYIYQFITQKPPMDLEYFYVKDLSNNVVDNISSVKGTQVKVYAKLVNTLSVLADNPQEYVVALVLKDDSGRIKVYEMAAGVLGGSEYKEFESIFDISSDANDDWKLECFVWDKYEKMNVLYPAENAEQFQGNIATDADINIPEINFATGEVVVSGFTPSQSSNERLSILVLGPTSEKVSDEELFDTILAGNSLIQTQQEIYTGENGAFRFRFAMRDVDATGIYNIYINGKEHIKFQKGSFSYISPQMIKQAAKSIIDATEQELQSMLIEAEKKLGYDSFVPYKNINKSLLASRIYPLIKKMNFDVNESEDIEALIEFIKKISVVELYNQGYEDLAINNAKSNYPEYISFDNVDSKYDCTAYDIFENGVSESGKRKIIQSLFNSNAKDTIELENMFIKSTMLYGITSSTKMGFGHIKNILTEKNIKAVSLSIPKYLSLTNTDVVDSMISENMSKITSLEKLEELINNYLDSVGNARGGGTAGSGNRGGFGTKTSFDIPANSVPQINGNKVSTEIFRDLPNSHWAYEGIMFLYDKGIINGKEPGRFAPDDSIKREEFIKIIAGAFRIETTDEESEFTDVAENDLFKPYINAVKKLGVVQGIDDSKFGMGQNISRQDVCAILYRIMTLLQDKKWADSNASFGDADEISEYALEAVKALAAEGIISGFPDNTFGPQHNCTRAQATKIIYEIIKKQEVYK